MASRFIAPVFDTGPGSKPASGSKLFFKETGTNTDRDTFTTAAADIPNANPVISDSNGVFPDIFINGTYKVILTDKDDIQVGFGEKDPIVESVDLTVISGLNPDTLAAWQDDKSALAGDVVTTKERSAGNSGGATGDIVSSLTVTVNGFDIVGHNTLALAFVLRLKQEINAREVGAKGDGSDATAALQACITLAKNKSLYIPAGVYQITSALAIQEPEYSPNDTIWIRGDGYFNTTLEGVGNIAVLFVQDQAGFKGGISGVFITNSTNIYNGGGVMQFIAPASIGIHIRDVFQFRIKKCIIEQQGTSLRIENFDLFSEGTLLDYVFSRRSKVGFHFITLNVGTESFSHTQLTNFQIQIPQDSITGKWQTGILVQGDPARPQPAAIYNSTIQGTMFTNDSTGDVGTLGEYVHCTNRGRITGTDLSLAFERPGKILIDPDSFIESSCITNLFSLDPSQLTFEDLNTNRINKFRSSNKSQIFVNLNGFQDTDWLGSGLTGDMRQGIQDSSASGYHYVSGTGIASPVLMCLDGTNNGIIFGSTSNFEDDFVIRARIDATGRVRPTGGNGAFLTQASGAPGSLTQGSLHLRNDTDRNVDCTPLWVGRDDDLSVMPMQPIYASSDGGRPSAPVTGFRQWNTTSSAPEWWNGTQFVEATVAPSDARLKTAPVEITDNECLAALAIKLIKFQFKEAITRKSVDEARWHYGVIAQDMEQVLIDFNIDAETFAPLLHNLVENDEGVDLYQVRYTELLVLRSEAMHRKLLGLI